MGSPECLESPEIRRTHENNTGLFPPLRPTSDEQKRQLHQQWTNTWTATGETSNSGAPSSSSKSYGDGPIIWQSPLEEKRHSLEITLVLFALCLCTILAALDVTIVTTALPTIAENFKTNQAGYTWVGAAYLLAGAASEPIWARFSDVFGRKPIIIMAQSVFFAGSIACAKAEEVGILIVGRGIQGFGAGGMLVLVNIIIADLFPLRKRGAYYGMMSMVYVAANVLGPFMGGAFAERIAWQWCFWVNLPSTAFAVITLAVFLDVKTERTPFLESLGQIDWMGTAVIMGGTIFLLLGLVFGGVVFSWHHAVVIVCIISGVVLIVLFFLIEARLARYPLIPIRIFKQRSNRAVLALVFCHGFVFMAASYYLPLYYQQVLGASPLSSGVYVFPYVIALSVASIVTGIAISKTGSYRPLVSFGALTMALGFLLFMDLPDTLSWPRLVIYELIAGSGAGILFQAPMIALQAVVQPHDLSAATGAFGFTRSLGAGMSVVIGSVVLNGRMNSHRADLFAVGIPADSVEDLTSRGAVTSSTDLINHLPQMQRLIARRALTDSFEKMWLMYAAFAILALGFTDYVTRRRLTVNHIPPTSPYAEQEKVRSGPKKKKAKDNDDEDGYMRGGLTPDAATGLHVADLSDVEKGGYFDHRPAESYYESSKVKEKEKEIAISEQRRSKIITPPPISRYSSLNKGKGPSGAPPQQHPERPFPARNDSLNKYPNRGDSLAKSRQSPHPGQPVDFRSRQQQRQPSDSDQSHREAEKRREIRRVRSAWLDDGDADASMSSELEDEVVRQGAIRSARAGGGGGGGGNASSWRERHGSVGWGEIGNGKDPVAGKF